MTSNAQATANRRNARKSTGPRTAAGKRRVSRNALRHGLAVPITLVAQYSSAIEKMSREYAGVDPGTVRREAARNLAARQLDLHRVRWAKVSLLERITLANEGSAAAGDARSDRSRVEVDDLWDKLARLERYERRAFSAQRVAIRNLGDANDRLAAGAWAPVKPEWTP